MKLFERLRKPRFLIVCLLLPLVLLVAHTTEHRFRLGLAVVLLGELVRLWANGYVGHVKVNATQRWRQDPKIGRFITAGPYAYVRHPLYFGTCLIGAGFCLIAGRVWLSALALGLFAAAYHDKMLEEEATILEEVGAPYEAYRAAVPRWWPTWRPYPLRDGRWSWEGLAASKEWKTLIWVLVMVILLYFREELFQEHERLATAERTKHLVILGLLVLLLLTDGVAELLKWRRRIRPSA